MKRQRRIEIDFNKTYNSKVDGEYKIIKEIESNGKHRIVLIQFADTGNIQEATLENAIRNSMTDRLKHTPDFNKIYQSNTSGPFKFIEILKEVKNGKISCKIQFIETGTIIEAYVCVALRGSIRDPYRKSVCGFGITGNNSTRTREANTWKSMIHRCYNQNGRSYSSYGGKGVTVCERWRYLDNFLIDIKSLPGYDLWYNNPGEYALDKDKLQMNIPENKKIYSPETCCFISIVDNAKYAGAYLNNINKNLSSNYIGVYKVCNNFRAAITNNGTNYQLGVYSSEIAAANIYNYASKYYNPNIDPELLNKVPEMTLDEIQSYRTNGKIMCEIIHK